MFKNGEIVKHKLDHDSENLFVVVKTTGNKIHKYSINGHAKYHKDNTLMVIKPVRDLDYPGEIMVRKSDYVPIMEPKKFTTKLKFI